VSEREASGWMQSLLSRWLRHKSSQPEDLTEEAGDSPQRKKAVQKRPRSPDAGKADGVLMERLSAVLRVFDFDSAARSRLNSLQSAQEWLLFVYDEMLGRFVQLREQGLLKPESSKMIEEMSGHLESMLAKGISVEDEVRKVKVESVLAENEELKKQIKALNAKYLKTGIVSDRELKLEEEVAYYKRRMREINAELQLAAKRKQALASAQEMIQSLRARNSLLSTKVEHQGKLIRSVATESPDSQNLVHEVGKLGEENQRLRVQLERHVEVLDGLHQRIPPSAPFGDKIQQLIKENINLFDQLSDKENRLDDLGSAGKEDNLPESLEKLQEEHAHLKGLMASKDSLCDFLGHQEEGNVDHNQAVELLRQENKRLKMYVLARDEQLKLFTANPTSRGMLKVIMSLKQDIKGLKRENESKEQYVQELDRQKKELVQQIYAAKVTLKETKQLRAELEMRQKLTESFKEVEEKYKSLRSEYLKIRSKHEATLKENDEMRQKIAKLTAEYEFLVKEYEHIFETISNAK